ncbi:hypothetical protein CLOM621_05316 [Clostridium sp. M62/1]|nr:hypothetical protein CLOM621_05316 [Clostridium sp. M62/1]
MGEEARQNKNREDAAIAESRKTGRSGDFVPVSCGLSEDCPHFRNIY